MGLFQCSYISTLALLKKENRVIASGIHIKVLPNRNTKKLNIDFARFKRECIIKELQIKNGDKVTVIRDILI